LTNNVMTNKNYYYYYCYYYYYYYYSFVNYAEKESNELKSPDFRGKLLDRRESK